MRYRPSLQQDAVLITAKLFLNDLAGSHRIKRDFWGAYFSVSLQRTMDEPNSRRRR